MSAKEVLAPEQHPPGKGKNSLLLLAVALLTALPLWLYQPEEGEEAFAGADNKAQAQITQIAPDYQPWFKPLLEPASGEIASLLFALQAALGAGVLGYWLGAAVTRERLKKELATALAKAQENGEKTSGEKAKLEKTLDSTVDRGNVQKPAPAASGQASDGDAC